jgi:SET domain-containing protein
MNMSHEPISSPLVDEWIRIAPSSIHGTGAFARWIIPNKTPIIQYRGNRISNADAYKQLELGNPYIFNLNDEFDLDGDVPENLARFINHSCRPNCESRQDGDEVWIHSLRDIAPDEEITMNYGFGVQDYTEHPCGCGEENCVGFVVAEEFFTTLDQDRINDPLP